MLPSRRDVTDPASLRALSHPIRQRILAYLRTEGIATSTTLARALGQNTGVTSYHLRQLAQHGFVAEVAGKGVGRERWWQAVQQDLRFPAPNEVTDESSRVAAEELERLALEADGELLTRYLKDRDQLPGWRDAALFSRSDLRLTTAELTRLEEEYIQLLERYFRPAESAPHDAVPVVIRMYAFPCPAE